MKTMSLFLFSPTEFFQSMIYNIVWKKKSAVFPLKREKKKLKKPHIVFLGEIKRLVLQIIFQPNVQVFTYETMKFAVQSKF